MEAPPDYFIGGTYWRAGRRGGAPHPRLDDTQWISMNFGSKLDDLHEFWIQIDLMETS